MKIDILTLFPHMFDGFLSESIIKRAINSQKVSINIIDFREFSKLNNKQVDDTPYGGGAGMVIKPDVVYDAYNSIKARVDSVVNLMSNYKYDSEDAIKKVNK